MDAFGTPEPSSAPVTPSSAGELIDDDLDPRQIGRRVEATFIDLDARRTAALEAIAAYHSAYKKALKDGYVTEELLKKFKHEPDKLFGTPARRPRKKP